MFIYCAHAGCGYKNEYSGLRPKFCGSCGNPFDAAFKRPSSPLPASVALRRPSYSHTPVYQEVDPETHPTLDRSCISVESENGGKLTVGQLQKMGDQVSFDRPNVSTRTTIQIGDQILKTPDAVKQEMLANMMAPVPVAQPISPSVQRRRRRK